MEGNSFNLEKQINDFLENFKQSANRTVDDDEWSCRLTRSKSKVDGLEMTGMLSSNLIGVTTILVTIKYRGNNAVGTLRKCLICSTLVGPFHY